MLPIPGRAHGSLRALGAAIGLAASLSLLGTSVLAQGVATLETPAPPGTQPSAAPGALATPPSDPQEAMLAFVDCIREHGVDMPDPRFDADGRVSIMVGGPDSPRIDPDVMQAAQEACGGLMGPGAPAGPAGSSDAGDAGSTETRPESSAGIP
jgi:hypothetical protein